MKTQPTKIVKPGDELVLGQNGWRLKESAEDTSNPPYEGWKGIAISYGDVANGSISIQLQEETASK
jgi:hypothetical protein